jgi:AraC family transcriptional regulator
MQILRDSINYMEDHLLEDLTAEDVSKSIHVSNFYYQKGFKILTGYSVSEYIRNRRLYVAALDLKTSNEKIIDLSYKYGYDTPESFTKAFVRFHGITPSSVKSNPDAIKLFHPLTVRIVMEGGSKMDVRIEKKEAFQIIGKEKLFAYDNSFQEIPKFWQEFDFRNACKEENNIGTYGVCIDDLENETKEFRYLIAGDYKGGNVCEGLSVVEIPEFTWAIFKCVGPMPGAIQDTNNRIFKEWLPEHEEYEIAAGYNIEWYSCGDVSANDYVSEVWIPVQKK